MTCAIRLEKVTLGYAGVPAVENLSGEFATGSLTAIVGANGSGKSTLMKGIVGRLRPSVGSIEVAGGRKRIAYLPQAADVDRSFPINVYDMVTMGVWPVSGLFGGIARRQRDRIEAAISAVGMTGFERRPIGSLSGGQMQRTLFARLLLQDARVIILDEPFTAIDAKTTQDLLDLVRRWSEEKRTILAVLHDLEIVRTVFPDTLALVEGGSVWGPTEDVILRQRSVSPSLVWAA